jgi:hypothetical protein
MRLHPEFEIMAALSNYLDQFYHLTGTTYPSEKIENSDLGRTYYFNRFGFRSEEYDESAKLNAATHSAQACPTAKFGPHI